VALSRAEPAAPTAGSETPGPAAIVPLDRIGLDAAVRELAARDTDLAAIVERHGPPPLIPERFLALTDEALLAIGFSRQKARYGRALATAVADGSLDLHALETVPDDEVDAALQALPGIGPWTSTIYLLMVLRRPDVWPVGDIALQESARTVKQLERRPDPVALSAIGEPWRPWRSVAARLLWHDYLARRGRSG
jgi:DNA-3-methyladenine glycosylase II